MPRVLGNHCGRKDTLSVHSGRPFHPRLRKAGSDPAFQDRWGGHGRLAPHNARGLREVDAAPVDTLTAGHLRYGEGTRSPTWAVPASLSRNEHHTPRRPTLDQTRLDSGHVAAGKCTA